MYEKPDFAKVKAETDLLSLIQSFTGEQGRHQGKAVLFHCPMHDDRTPSFVVYPEDGHWICKGDCNHSGDVFEFVQKYYRLGEASGPVSGVNDPRMQAYDILTGSDFKMRIEKARDEYKARAANRPAKKPIVPDMEVIKGYHALRMETLRYFVDQRHLSENTVDSRLLGTNKNAPNLFEWQDGREEWFHCTRYVIPWMWGNNAYMANARRDDEQCLKMVRMLDPEMHFAYRMDIAKDDRQKAADITDMELVEYLFGGKYKRTYGSGGRSVFNLNRLFRMNSHGDPVIENGHPVKSRLQYCLIHEAEISALCMEELGYPSVAVHMALGVNYADVFSHVVTPIIVADNDHGTGMEKAQALARSIGSRTTRIIVMPSPFKDANEATVHDSVNHDKVVSKLMKSYNLESQWSSLVF